MSEKINPNSLRGKWVHAHEEDTPKEMVFRPAALPLPPSRGRVALELLPDQTLSHTGISRGDGPEAISGTWELVEGEGDIQVLHIHLATGETQLLQIINVGPDCLLVRKSE